jgi:hypothetical protein
VKNIGLGKRKHLRIPEEVVKAIRAELLARY